MYLRLALTLFNPRCAQQQLMVLCRADQSTCYTKDSIYYWTTCMGLHTLTNYYLEQALWLAQTPTSAIKISNPTLFYLSRSCPANCPGH